jgi:putative ABC transport system permease protein
MLKAVVGLQTRDFGFAIDDVLTGFVSLPASDYPDDLRRVAFYREVERRLSETRGVRASATSSALPGENGSWWPFEADGQAAEPDQHRPATQAITVSPGFFRAFGVSMLEGRGFLLTDAAAAQPVAIVNRRFVERFFPDGRALGRRVRLIEPEARTNPWRVIVGVAPNMFVGGSDLNRDWAVYVPLEQHPMRAMSIVVRATGAPGVFSASLRQAVAAVDPGLPVGPLSTMQDVMFLATWQTRLFGSLFGAFGIASLFLSVVGLYGVVSFSTGQRTRELGIRLALGATPARLVSLILRSGLWQLLAGSVTGLAAGIGLSSVFVQLEPSMRVVDPVPLAVVLGTFVSATVVAHLVPAGRAMRALRSPALRE